MLCEMFVLQSVITICRRWESLCCVKCLSVLVSVITICRRGESLCCVGQIAYLPVLDHDSRWEMCMLCGAGCEPGCAESWWLACNTWCVLCSFSHKHSSTNFIHWYLHEHFVTKILWLFESTSFTKSILKVSYLFLVLPDTMIFSLFFLTTELSTPLKIFFFFFFFFFS